MHVCIAFAVAGVFLLFSPLFLRDFSRYCGM
jgi:hypothetical protein